MRGRDSAYFRDAAADARALHAHGFEEWPDAEGLARYAFEVAIEAFIRFDHSYVDTVAELGYPTNATAYAR